MDPRTVLRLVEEGKMPHIKYLLENGVFATPDPLLPAISTLQWTSMMTGDLGTKHGIQNFVAKTDDPEKFTLLRSSDRRVKTLWNIFTEKGYKVGVFNFVTTWPLEKTLGYTIADTALADFDKSITPESLLFGLKLHLAQTIGLERIKKGMEFHFPLATGPNDANFFRVAHEQLSILNTYTIEASRYAYNTLQPDIIFQEDDVLDYASALFLKFQQPEEYEKYGGKIDPELLATYKDYIDNLYIERDTYVGEFLKTADSSTQIIVTSDHGYFIDATSGYRFENFNKILEFLGFLRKHEDGSIDFSRTIAFECLNNSFDWHRQLCINLQGRYKTGIVPQTEFEATRKRVLDALKVVATTDGKSLYNTIDITNTLDGDIMYDLDRNSVEKSVVFNGKTYPVKDFLTPVIESGQHYANPKGPPAFFVWSGPGIRKGVKLERLSAEDYAPNILHALGMPIARDMDGKFIPEFFERPTEPRYIDSYEDNVNRVFPGHQELTDGHDAFALNGSDISVYLSVDPAQAYKKMCLRVPTGKDFRLQMIGAGKAAQLNLPFVAAGNPRIDQPLSVQREYVLSTLPHIQTTVFLPKDFIFPPESDKLYAFKAALNPDTPQELAMWTNMSFTVHVPSEGMLKVLAKGDSVKGVFPRLEVALNGEVIGTIQVGSATMQPYHMIIPREGEVRIAYINDEIVGHEDRNAYIGGFVFSKTNVFRTAEPTSLFMENNQLCFFSEEKGSVQFVGRLLPIVLKPLDDPGMEQLKKAQDVGEFVPVP